MGRDKALLPFRGRPLAAAVADAVAQAAGNVVLVGDPARYAVLGLPSIPDRFPGEGPLGGILTALAATDSEWNLVTACDMPALDASFLLGLFIEAEARDAQVLLPQDAAGRVEPLCAVYRRDALYVLESAFGRGVRKVTDAFAGLAVSPLIVPEVVHFQNVNTPEDWAAHAPV